MQPAWIPQNIPVGGPPTPPAPPSSAPPGKDKGKPASKPTVVNSSGKWNHPERIDSIFGWLLVSVVGGIVFVMLGQNLVPYWDYFGAIASNMFESWRGRNLLWILPLGSLVFWSARIIGGSLGVALFTVIQYTELRPQLLWKRLPKGAERNRRLTAAFILLFVALALDVWFCFLFWPPVNSALGWGVFRAGFSWALVNKWNMVRTFFTLFGGIIFLFVKDFIAKYW